MRDYDVIIESSDGRYITKCYTAENENDAITKAILDYPNSKVIAAFDVMD